MRGACLALAATVLVAGCETIGTTAMAPSGAASVDAPAERTSPFPTTASLAEGSRESQAGRPDEPAGLSVIEKRHLYARRVMAECVRQAPDFDAGLEGSALQPAPRLSSGARSFADRTFQVAASTNGRTCDVRALGGTLDDYAEGMESAFRTRGELLGWERAGDVWRGRLLIDGVGYSLSAEQVRLDGGFVVISRITRG